nr:MAG TPA: hypothetical protein [Caudoviricetes sp.]
MNLKSRSMVCSFQKPIARVRGYRGEISVFRVVGLDVVRFVQVIVLEFLRSLDLRNRANGHEGQCSACCEYSGACSDLLSVSLECGDEVLLVELELDNRGVSGGVVGVHGGILSDRGVSYKGQFLSRKPIPQVNGVRR